MVVSLIINLFLLVFLFLIISFTSIDHPLRNHYWQTLVYKTAMGKLLGAIYYYYYQGGDTIVFFQEAVKISNYFWQHPTSIFSVISGQEALHVLVPDLLFGDDGRSLFFVKILSGVVFVSGNNYWMASTYFTLINFMSAWWLSATLYKYFQIPKPILLISLFYFPGVAFWTSGILKETIAVSCIFVISASAIEIIKGYRLNILKIFLALASMLVLWKLKYYYAVIFIPLALSWFIVFVLAKPMSLPKSFTLRSEKAMFLMVFIGLALVGSIFHPNLNINHVLDVVYGNYELFQLKCTEGNCLHFYHFDGSITSFLINIPIAIVSGLFRPSILEASTVLSLVPAIENLLLLALLMVALIKQAKRVTEINTATLASCLYIIILSAFLAFSTPNFGTLSRYKVGFMPFLLLVLLMWNKTWVLNMLKTVDSNWLHRKSTGHI